MPEEPPGDEADDEAGGGRDDAGTGTQDPDRGTHDARGGNADPRGGVDVGDDDAPLADLREAVDERRRRREAADDPFERMEVGDVDGETAWASLSEGAGPESSLGAAERAEGGDDRTEHVVDKREYCQRCRYFADPPTVACEHEGTDILEVVEADRFRVRGCPMVTEEGPPNFGPRKD